MKTEPKRVKKIDSPLLLIGLGGTGSDALLTIMDKFNRRYVLPVTANGDVLDTPERTGYLAFDTDALELKGKKIGNMSFRKEHIFELTIPSRLGTGTLPGYISQWWDPNLTGLEIKDGAGGIRQAGRFVLFYNADAIVAKLKTRIGSLLATTAEGTMGTLEIVLSTGISGGTGSGTFLDMAYLIRYTMERFYPNVSYNFMAYILMPPVNVDKISQAAAHKSNMLESTGFAALKELDFWMNYHTHQYQFVQQYSETIQKEWNKKPFDNVVLMGNAKVDGTLIINAYENCLDVLSESVVNFFAHETSDTKGPIALRSHLSNIAQEHEFLKKIYPANYTYMTVGAASSESQEEAMVTYETKLTFDRIEHLQNIDDIPLEGSVQAAPMLGHRAGDEFIDRFMPATTDYFTDFANVCPDLGIFTDPTWTPKVVMESEPVHQTFYQDWQHECELAAKKYANDQIAILRDRFNDLVMAYATDLTYGPYTLSAFLKNTEKGFARHINDLVDMWDHHANNIRSELNASFAHVQGDLYSRMSNMSVIEKMTGLLGPAKRYFDGCQGLFAIARDYELSNALSTRLHDLKKSFSAYYDVVLPAFCNLLTNFGMTSEQDAQELNGKADPSSIASVGQLKEYLNKAFGDVQQCAEAQNILKRMILLSQSVNVNNMGALEGMEEARNQLLKATDQFVMQAAQGINGISMDHLLNITMPDATQQERVDYISDTLLPRLSSAAQTMLPLKVASVAADQYIPYAYVSIPNNAPTIEDGVKAFSESQKITPKRSDVSDKIFWLNTYNCVPLYMYTDLARLEKVYNENRSVGGLHLVQSVAEGGLHILRRDWSLLPSPVMHLLDQLPIPAKEKETQDEIANALEESFASGTAVLSTLPNGSEQLQLRLRMNAEGRPETMDQLTQKISAIVNDENLLVSEKEAKLTSMKTEGVLISKEYGDYSVKFAEAAGLKLHVDFDTTAEHEQVKVNREKARHMVATYILYAWYPQIAELLIQQKEMVKKIQQAIDDLPGKRKHQKEFVLLYLNDFFIFARSGIKYKDFRGEEVTLLNKADMTEEELTVYADFSNVLSFASVFTASKNTRLDQHDLDFLLDKAKELEIGIDNLPDAEYDALVSKAAAFRTQHAQIGDAIKYSKSNLPVSVRNDLTSLMSDLMTKSKIYS